MEALVAFAAALISFRLAGLLAARYRSSGRPELLAWAAGLAAYAVAAAAIAWGEAAGWDGRAFRVYYAAGALLTAPLLGAGSLLLAGRRRGERNRDRRRRGVALRRIRRTCAHSSVFSPENGRSLSHKRCLYKAQTWRLSLSSPERLHKPRRAVLA
jgi:hypothetical protein